LFLLDEVRRVPCRGTASLLAGPATTV